jgi:hypothetical protein
VAGSFEHRTGVDRRDAIAASAAARRRRSHRRCRDR